MKLYNERQQLLMENSQVKEGIYCLKGHLARYLGNMRYPGQNPNSIMELDMLID